MFEAKRLHPMAIFLNALEILKGALFPFLAFILLNGSENESWYLDFIWIGVYILGSSLYGLIKWFTFTYHVEDDEILIKSGIFVKQKRYIRFERIQSIDASEGIFQRLFSLVKVTIDTAGTSSGKAEVVLTAVTKEEAQTFQTLLYKSKNIPAEEEQVGDCNEETFHIKSNKKDDGKTVFNMSFKEIFLMALTSGSVGVVASGGLAIISQLSEYIELDKVYSKVQALVALASVLLIIFIIIVGLMIAYIIATIGILVKYAYFTVKKTENDLVITRGLLERRQLTIPIDKLQAIRIVENIIRQPLGYATVYAETASGSLEDRENSKVMLFPLIKKSQLETILKLVTNDYTAEDSIKPVPKKALIRYIFRQWIIWFPVIVILIYFFRPIGYLSFGLLLLGLIWGYLLYREAGWNIAGNQVTLCYRYVSKHTYIVRMNKIQPLSIKQSWSQRRGQLGSVTVFSKAGPGPSSGKVVDLDREDYLIIKRWFQR